MTTPIKLHNTKTRKKEVFEPIDDKNVRMYVCGPTVYDRAHIGNARPVVVFDILYRLLRHVYGPDHVTYVRNFTDVDDKINATALARKEAGAAGTIEDLVQERTEETIDWYLKDMGALGAMQPNDMPRATQYIPQMVAMCEDLIAKGHAYAADGHVLFSVESYKEYGALSGRSVDDMIAGARVEVAPYKRNPMDFVLWKPSTDELPGWDSPWGRGRPGWHIECSAMSYELLGASFDIHGGGNDLMFPHHENEIAQSCCANGADTFANYWLHNEMLQVEGKKMSKSLGNFFTVRDLLDGHDGQPAVPGEVIRFVFLSTHYGKPMDWTAQKAAEAKMTLHKWRLLTEFVEPGKPSKKVIQALSDDLNTPQVITELGKISDRKDAATLKASAQLIGLLQDEFGSWSWKKRPIEDFVDIPEWHPAGGWISKVMEKVSKKIESFALPLFRIPKIDIPTLDFDIPKMELPKIDIPKPNFDISKIAPIRGVNQMREALLGASNFLARLQKDYPDEMSCMNKAMPFSVLSISLLNFVKEENVHMRIELRQQAKLEKNYMKADQIRNELNKIGIEIIDTAEGTKWDLLPNYKLETSKGLK